MDEMSKQLRHEYKHIRHVHFIEILLRAFETLRGLNFPHLHIVIIYVFL